VRVISALAPPGGRRARGLDGGQRSRVTLFETRVIEPWQNLSSAHVPCG